MTRAEWIPPSNPDLHEILREADKDQENAKYAASLEKHIWFHENALKYDQSFYGVRLSYALASWVQLSKVYEPALTALINLSDKNEVEIKSGKADCGDAFHDFVSINRELGRQEKIVALFKWLDTNNLPLAKRKFNLAKPALVLANEYELCGKYVEPENDYAKFVEMYMQNLQLAKDPKFGSELKEFAENTFSNEVTILVATLQLNNRHDEAKKIAAQALKIMDTSKLKKELNKAISGKMPAPWP